MKAHKLPILNDPIYGFISIDSELIFDLIAHPYFQRLRRISQMGLSSLVFPGARHSRFEHALGAMHLMTKAIGVLKQKGIQISEDEAEALKIAILLHDIGHGPFSHAMEESIILGVHHETLSIGLMRILNDKFSNKLSLAIEIFTNSYSRKFMYQLVSSQLDVDRLDYLKRDSFYTGALEGNINSERILSMINVIDDELVVEENGLFSVEKFVLARRMMYWQVYLHKTSLNAELLLEKTLSRARLLIQNKVSLPTTPILEYFLKRSNIDIKNPLLLDKFTLLDDIDVLATLKQWQFCEDEVLAHFSRRILNRDLLKIKIADKPFEDKHIERKKEKLRKMGWSKDLIDSFVFKGAISNQIYAPKKNAIRIMNKKNQVKSFENVSNLFVGDSLQGKETKYYLCYPKLK